MEPILNQAKEKERDYDWLAAIKSYNKALSLVPEQNFSSLGGIYERLGYASYRAAMQAENAGQFREKMHHASAHYESAREFYGRLDDPGRIPRMLRCEAMIAFIGFWLAEEVPEKKRLIDECWAAVKEALTAFDKAGDSLEYGLTFNQLSRTAAFKSDLEWDNQAYERTVKDAFEHGEQAIRCLSAFEDPCEFARTYVRTANYLQELSNFLDLDEKERAQKKAMEYWQNGCQLSEDVALIESYDFLNSFGYGSDKALASYEKMLNLGRKAKDRFIIGFALDALAYHTVWEARANEDPDESVKLITKALEYAEEARTQLSVVSYISGPSPFTPPDYYWELAGYETDVLKRRGLLEKAVEAAPDMMDRAEKSGRFPAALHAHHTFSKILASLAKIEEDISKREILLEKALGHRKRSIEIVDQVDPPTFFWNRGLMRNYLADVKSELADLIGELESKKSMLRDALSEKENALTLCTKDAEFWERKGSVSLFASLSNWQYEYGNLLNRFYLLSSDKDDLRRALEAFERAAEFFRKLGLASRISECCWKIAQTYDAMGKSLKSAENFYLASNSYRSAAERIPQLRDFYLDHALYMQAWGEIEKARHHHVRQQYGLAEEHFEQAASLHKSLRQWNYLTPNYSAWAKVESAEELSRKEQSEEAINAFTQAAKLFEESKKSLEAGFSNIRDSDEKQMATGLLKATDFRREYCMARIAIEEARILDKKGDHYSSSEKYGSAAETFDKILQALQSEEDRREFKLIITLSHAWQKMTRAEAEVSPTLYLEASQLFLEAKELSPNETARLLALGHRNFCRALEAGTKFADTRDATLHALAVQHLESAANYYLQAGFPQASEYAKATELLFDAYMHMAEAKKEQNQEKKARLYAMVEKILQASAGSFMKAGHPGKREQALRLLEKVKEERELALSLHEVLHAPTIVSTTTAFSTPTPTHENAVGLERFEHADIQANVTAREKELKVGENLDLEIELVNTGKGPAVLTKITEVVPEGFELTEKPEMYRVEDSYLNMKGKRLDPLKTEEVRLVLKPKVQGVFPLKPRVLYLDENGKYKSHEPEPVTITVRELGIKGWLKGER